MEEEKQRKKKNTLTNNGPWGLVTNLERVAEADGLRWQSTIRLFFSYLVSQQDHGSLKLMQE